MCVLWFALPCDQVVSDERSDRRTKHTSYLLLPRMGATEEDGLYFPERVCAVKRKGNSTKILVKWKG